MGYLGDQVTSPEGESPLPVSFQLERTLGSCFGVRRRE